VPIRIAIADQQEALPVDRARLRDVIRRTLRSEEIHDADISLALLDDPAIHELNRRHLQHDYPTDVLSFLLSEPGTKPLEGELLVSTDTATTQAAEFGWSPEDELTLYIVHGLLHLCGYDDHAAADLRRMREREREVLSFWGLTPHYRA
jgi:probable rRNA maturation factor